MKKTRALALSPVPIEGAGCRFRIAQYIPYLEAHGIEVTVSPFFTPKFFRLAYRKGRYLEKAVRFVSRSVDRLRWLAARGDYDLIFIYREAFPIGPPWLETALARSGGPAIVYDFDDAIFLPNTSQANRVISFLKYPQKVASIISRSDRVIAGNNYLAGYARQYNDAVTVIPTCVDTRVFVPKSQGGRSNHAPVVGWIGSPTTAWYLSQLGNPLKRAAGSHRFVLRVAGAGEAVRLPGVNVDNLDWSLEREVDLFNTCDVGVYPLVEDEWAKGKCGFKAIQFMACGIPVVASAVGVNREIITDGVNGFLASTEDEWVEKLEALLSDERLRTAMGAAARETVEARYSLLVNAPKLMTALNDAMERTPEEPAALHSMAVPDRSTRRG